MFMSRTILKLLIISDGVNAVPSKLGVLGLAQEQLIWGVELNTTVQSKLTVIYSNGEYSTSPGRPPRQPNEPISARKVLDGTLLPRLRSTSSISAIKGLTLVNLNSFVEIFRDVLPHAGVGLSPVVRCSSNAALQRKSQLLRQIHNLSLNVGSLRVTLFDTTLVGEDDNLVTVLVELSKLGNDSGVPPLPFFLRFEEEESSIEPHTEVGEWIWIRDENTKGAQTALFPRKKKKKKKLKF
jgi:hypothetical protein